MVRGKRPLAMSENWDFLTHNETFDAEGKPREVYRALFDRLNEMPRTQVRALDDQLEATMREMGVTFDIKRDRVWGQRAWFCDLLPQIFTPDEWEPLANGIRQRLKAFEAFLQDIYSKKQILLDGVIPINPVLGSPFFQRAAAGLPLPAGAYLHLSGISICRLPDGQLAAKHHYFSNASGMSYMIQNRRALTRVIPQSFQDTGILSISDAPTNILEMLRSFSKESDPMVVLLSPGPLSPAYSEHSFLARRMGIPLVQGGDLLVLNDEVYLKTVSGLSKVDVIYTRVSDQWLDPMVFRRDSNLGIPGLAHCVRRQSVAVINAIGSQISDDRALLPFASQIIRYYLGERPILPAVPTFWMGDIDQREHVLEDLQNFTIRPLSGERILLGGDGRLPSNEKLEAAKLEILENPSQFVAQPQDCDAETISFQDGERRRRRQDHILFAQRKADGSYEVFPGALTRVSTTESEFTSSELGGGSKDTWVQVGLHKERDEWDPSRQTDAKIPAHGVTSRVAEAFYWIGRYLERAYDLAGMVSVIESLEIEELNPTERMNYRPVWNRILPMLEGAGSPTRRTISSPAGRYRLTLDTNEPGSVVSTILRAAGNAESVLETLSLDAWGVLSVLRNRFRNAQFAPDSSEEILTSSSRRLCDIARQLIPQFFGTAQCTMLSDDGWNFCEIGQLIERAAITANAITSITKPLLQPSIGGGSDHAMEIRLSAFLRLLNSRDIYRRVYQMRIEPLPLLELLWTNPVAPRSVVHCLTSCVARIRGNEINPSPSTARALAEIESLIQSILSTNWESLLSEQKPQSQGKTRLQTHCESLLNRLLSLHTILCDSFLNHQVLMHVETKPLFQP
ncbi:MAG: hypothetical protein B9S31_01345 [Spartobacteria bacterium Tous-C9RFEB]|nr:MAG: hypothetical protein B9S31_01345 [Spartobacteria bacterium Tous-C9RFEB]